MKMSPKFCLVLLSLFALAVSSVEAQSHGSDPEQHTQGEPPHSQSHQSHFHRNELALVLASTHESEEDENLFTIGGEYERRFTSRVGLTAGFEHLSEVDGWVFVFPLTVRIAGGLKALAGPGFEHLSRRPTLGGHEVGHSETSEEHPVESGADNLFLFRIGAQYAFEIGERFSVAPGIALDFIDEEHGVAKAVLYGVNLGIAF